MPKKPRVSVCVGLTVTSADDVILQGDSARVGVSDAGVDKVLFTTAPRRSHTKN